MTNNKTLIFLTDSFPYDAAETFVQNEIAYLSEAFKSVIIISSADDSSTPLPLPENVTSFNLPAKLSLIDKISGVKYLFSSLFREEMGFIHGLGVSINLLVIKTALDALISSEKVMNYTLEIMKEQNVDLAEVVVYSYWNDFKALAAGRLKGKHNSVIALARAHNWDLYFERQPNNYLPLKKKTVEMLDAIYFISEDGRTYFNKKLGNPSLAEKMKVSLLGVKGSGMEEKDIKEISAKLASDRNQRLLIVSCSKVEPVKRLNLIVECLGVIEERNIDWVHLGGGSQLDSIKKLASRTLDKKDNISYQFKGGVSNEEVYNYYSNNDCHVLINLSEYEGIPISMMEAMSFGIPILATDVGGVAELIDHAGGILLPATPTAEETARTIIEMIEMDEDQYRDLRIEAFQTWNTRYETDENYKEFIGELNLLADHGNKQ